MVVVCSVPVHAQLRNTKRPVRQTPVTAIKKTPERANLRFAAKNSRETKGKIDERTSGRDQEF